MTIHKQIPTAKKSFSIIITSFNEREWLKKTIDSILGEKSYDDYEIILIDDASTDDSFDFLKSDQYKSLVESQKIIIERVNSLGISAGRHAGALMATNDILIFLDAHMKISPNWLIKINDAFSNHKHIKLLGLKIYEIEGKAENFKYCYSSSDLTMINPSWIYLEEVFPQEIVKVPFINGANFIIDKKVYFKIGGFPSYIKGWGIEDRALCLAAYLAGYDTYMHYGIEIGHFFKTNIKLTKVQTEKFSKIVYSSLAASYVLYSPEFHKRTIKLLKSQFPENIFDTQLKEFHANRILIAKDKKKLKNISKRTFQNFIKDNSDFLYFIHLSNLGEALTPYHQNPDQALKLVNQALKARFFPDEKQKNNFISACKLVKAYLLNFQNPQAAIDLIWEVLQSNMVWIPITYLAAEIFFQQKNYQHAIAFFTLTYNLLDHKDIFDNNPLATFPTKTPAEQLYQISQCHYYTGNYTQAIKYIEKSLELEPTRIEFQNNLFEYQKQLDLQTLNTPGCSPEKVFNIIHKHNIWGSTESVSGHWASIQATSIIRQTIPEIIKKYKIQSVLDVPCGDVNWIKEIFTSFPNYTGIDIVSELIIKNNAKYASENIKFMCKNLISDQLPSSDLLLCRDCLPHLTLEEIRLALINFVESRAKYLLTTTYPLNEINRDIHTGQWRYLNLQIAPFNLPPPLLAINEDTIIPESINSSKSLGLWLMEDVKKAILQADADYN